MIESITVQNFKGEEIELVLRYPERSGLAVKAIDGIGPAHSNINYQELATSNGGIFTSARTPPRSINLTLMPMDLPSVEENRHLIYQFMPLKKNVRLTFNTTVRKLYCEGYVESTEPAIFADGPDKETVTVAILCLDPWFYAPGDSATVFSGVEARFEFPFSNESLTQNLIEFGNILPDTRANLYYTGDIDAGVEITVHAMAEAEKIRLFNVRTFETMTIDTDKIAKKTSKPLGAGDDILINTTPGKRSVQLLRNGVYSNIIYALNRESDWLMITPGDNFFGYDAEHGASNIVVTYSYRNTYGGV